MSALDAISGVPSGYYAPLDVTVSTTNGPVAATTYVIPRPHGTFQPTAAYVQPILAGARALHLPAEYVAELEATIQAARAGAIDA